MKIRRFGAPLVWGLLLSALSLGLSACHTIYYNSSSNYAGRPTPPSGLQQRVMAAYTANGSSGGLEILDGLRDIRSNVQNTIPAYSIKGYGGAYPIQIINYPEQTSGYVLSYTDGSLASINYGTEASSGNAASFGAYPSSATVSTDGSRAAGAAGVGGILFITTGGISYPLNLPNVYRVAMNRGNTVILAMVRNSNALYRVIKLNNTSTVTAPPGAIDCQPLLLPVYCVVPVPGTFDHPQNAVFSTDGNSVYVLDCGPECGGTTAGITVLQEGALTVDNLNFTAATQQTLPVANPIPIPGGATAALSNGTTLYISGQSTSDLNNLFGGASGAGNLFTGYMTAVNLTTYAAGSPVSISDGTHTKMLFADDNTLWIGSQQCANGKRAALATTQLNGGGATTAASNTNCLTRVALSAAAPTASIVPAVVQSNNTTTPVQVPYPNTDLNYFYYGSLTGLCWVQNYHKIYTAYGGQIHAFNTADGSEINNYYITIQGNVLDVAYMDALTNEAN